jgi:hypothetical protein
MRATIAIINDLFDILSPDYNENPSVAITLVLYEDSWLHDPTASFTTTTSEQVNESSGYISVNRDERTVYENI